MRTRALLVIAATACGASSPPGSSPGGVVGPPHVAWYELTRAQQAEFMGRMVLPKFTALVHDFDAHAFEKVQCVTCHGPGAEDRTFKMPNPSLYALPESQADFARLSRDKPAWMRLMVQVEREMATTLDLRPFDASAPGAGWSGCYSCHPHKPGGGDAG